MLVSVIARRRCGVPSDISVVNTEKKVCKPFTLRVMVVSPEAGYKFEVLIERSCTEEKDEIWKLVFDLYRRTEEDPEFVQIVHVSFTAGANEEEDGVKRMLADGASKKQADVLVDEVFPATKAIEGVSKPTTPQKDRIRTSMRKAVTVDV
jgi:hypothetical protein